MRATGVEDIQSALQQACVCPEHSLQATERSRFRVQSIEQLRAGCVV